MTIGTYTDYLRGAPLATLLAGKLWSGAPTLYCGLSIAPANRRGVASEPDGGGYARVPVPLDGRSLLLLGGLLHNAAPIAFPAAAGPWGLCLSAFLADEAGNPWLVAPLPVPMAVAAGMAPTIAAGALYFDPASG